MTLKVCFEVLEPEGKSLTIIILNDTNYKHYDEREDYEVIHYDAGYEGCSSATLINIGIYWLILINSHDLHTIKFSWNANFV